VGDELENLRVATRALMSAATAVALRNMTLQQTNAPSIIY
jgi:hypothetical protein